MNFDKETRETLMEAQKAKRLTSSEEWKWAKRKLELLIEAINSLDTLTNFKTATAIKTEIDIRKRSVALVRTWVEEVENAALQQDFNQLIEDNLSEQLIVRRKE